MEEIEHVFISHYHEDEANIEKMRSLLGDSYTIKNSSVTSDKFNRAQDLRKVTFKLYFNVGSKISRPSFCCCFSFARTI